MSKTDEEGHRLLAVWAADCAERVLYVFERSCNGDRPRKAIEAARSWACGEMKISEAHEFELSGSCRCA